MNKLHFDQHGLLGQPYPQGIEGGDSASWTGLYVYITNDNTINYDQLEVGFGAYVRHPVHHPILNRFGSYYSNPYDGVISRDQLTGIILARIAQKNRLALLRIIAHHGLRLFLFSYNTRKNGVEPSTAPWKVPDFTGPDIWSLYLRGFGILSWIFFPLLCILDLHTLLNALYITYIKKEDEHLLNFTAKLLCSLEHVPTPISLLTAKVVSIEQIELAMVKYWCGWRDNCKMANLFMAKVEKYIGD